MEKFTEKLLWGDKKESKEAKDALKKCFDKKLSYSWKSDKGAKEDRKKFGEEMLSVYEKLFVSYDILKNHNKCSVLSFMSRALFYFKDDAHYFEKFLMYVRQALKDEVDGTLRQIAVKTSSNSYAVSTIDNYKKKSKKEELTSRKYFNIIEHHIVNIFDTLETIIEEDENNFPLTIEEMKPSVVKSHLLYLFEFDRFGTLEYLAGLYEEEDFFKGNAFYAMWKDFYRLLLESHPEVKKFLSIVPRYDFHKYEQGEDYDEDEYDTSEIIEIIEDILNREEGILSSEFFADKSEEESFLMGFSAPRDGYFEIWDLVGDIDDKSILLEVYDMVYIKAHRSPVSDIYWYDLLNLILDRIGDHKLYLKILGEAIKKLSPKVDVHSPINKDGKNMINYGIHELRPIFRILIAYAVCNYEYGEKSVAKEYLEFLLKLNPWDNQGVRYLLAALYTDKPFSCVGKLFNEGNKNQDWDKIENFLNEQNAKHHFWNEAEASDIFKI